MIYTRSCTEGGERGGGISECYCKTSIVSYHIIPYHIISYHTIPCRIISYGLFYLALWPIGYFITVNRFNNIFLNDSEMSQSLMCFTFSVTTITRM